MEIMGLMLEMMMMMMMILMDGAKDDVKTLKPA